MPRPPRSFAPGGFYHLTARANGGGALFADHLDLRTRDGEISRAMKYLNGEYAKRFNERHAYRGHLFESRFRTTTLVDEQHREWAIEYVLANPVRAGIVAAPADCPWPGAVGAAP